MPETTQSDLVERLTEMAALYCRAISDDNEDAQTFADAATEITRLRAHCEAIADAADGVSRLRGSHSSRAILRRRVAAYRNEGGA
ncbi:hypothetical protein [Novosphingobium sp. ST904]|uniref:hypothetical protein n=1 Tax=Novosphingobium sp. ST904 TaxID=1684385 RepID=UPI0006C87EA2|nr:hypothetical protein [Novosphingobium sp. ST904]KPH67078.1 hypothetical protein ADT71_02980 [Novosphingobium sp. ST904]TCM25151.1 hypothetical protein EDF59_14413 [Novosphingobium sp. ST904]